MEVKSFTEIEPEFMERVQRIVWCTVATIDPKGRPRSRILHPIWQGSTGWICTGRQTLKARHLRSNPFVSLTYWDPQQEQIHADCRAEWADEPAERERIWNLFQSTPEPVGYNPALFWPQGPTDPNFGALKLTPWRLELWSLAELASGKPGTVWHNPEAGQ